MVIKIDKKDEVIITIQEGKMRILLNNRDQFYPKMVTLKHCQGLNTTIEMEGDWNELHSDC